MHTVASFSGGKDSTAMVLRMVELGQALDEVLFCDTGMELPGMQDHIKKFREYVESEGVAFVTLKGWTWDYGFSGVPIKSKPGHVGFGFPGISSRWCTKRMKVEPIRKHIAELEEECDGVVQCVGIAADEPNRAARLIARGIRCPLVEWGWDEKICLGYCYGKSFDWFDASVGKGLYEIFDRTGCYCCPFQSVDSLRQLRRHYPELWKRIGEMEAVNSEKSFKNGRSWREIDARFEVEDMRVHFNRTIDDFLEAE